MESSDGASKWSILGLLLFSWGLGAITTRYLLKEFSAEFASRIVSGVHAILTIAFGCGILWEDMISRKVPIGTPYSTWTQQLILLNSMAYFTVDLLGIVFSSYFSLLFIAHHVLCIACLLFCCIYESYCYDVAVVLLLCELTNPFLHGRWLLAEFEKEDTRWFMWISELFYLLFFVTRIVIGPLLTWRVLSSDASSVIKFCSITLQAASVQFFVDKVVKRVCCVKWR
jgi:multisubunit Na+/H+ antiporter MnhF subunit